MFERKTGEERKKKNFTMMIRYGFHPGELHSLVGEVGPHTAQYNTCHVVINAINIKKARVRVRG